MSCEVARCSPWASDRPAASSTRGCARARRVLERHHRVVDAQEIARLPRRRWCDARDRAARRRGARSTSSLSSVRNSSAFVAIDVDGQRAGRRWPRRARERSARSASGSPLRRRRDGRLQRALVDGEAGLAARDGALVLAEREHDAPVEEAVDGGAERRLELARAHAADELATDAQAGDGGVAAQRRHVGAAHQHQRRGDDGGELTAGKATAARLREMFPAGRRVVIW